MQTASGSTGRLLNGDDPEREIVVLPDNGRSANVHEAKVELRPGVALLSGLAIPLEGCGVVLRIAPAARGAGAPQPLKNRLQGRWNTRRPPEFRPLRLTLNVGQLMAASQGREIASRGCHMFAHSIGCSDVNKTKPVISH